MVAAYKMLTPPEFGAPGGPVATTLDPLQCPNGYQVLSFRLPCEHVGGDWLGVDHTNGEDLWTIVIDVTSHGYLSYITASGFSCLWESGPIVELRALGRSPREVLGVISQELEQVLPDEVFIEACLGRFTAAGEASVAGAGNCRVILRRAERDDLDMKRIGGHLLGSFWGNDHDQESWNLLAGDELTIASDGLYEQPDLDGHQLVDRIVEHITRCLAPGVLMHNAVLEVLTGAVGDQSQRDDITVLTVLRCGETRP
jgi:sigma-B regulation protein RsbU (phosphoserine phosphatase)